MVHIEVVLGIITPSPYFKANDPHLLVAPSPAGFTLPNAPLTEQESSLEVAARLFKGCTGLQPRIRDQGYIPLVPIGVSDSPTRVDNGFRTIAVPYGALVPHSITVLPKGMEWLPLAKTINETFLMDYKDIALEVCRRLSNV